MSEKKLCRELVKQELFNNIKINIPNYKYLNDTSFKEVIDFTFDKVGKEIYTENEANEFIRSFVKDKLMAKSVTGHLTPWEVAFVKCDKKGSFKWKGNASMGGAEWWVHFILGWDFSEKKGCDLKDLNGEHVDIKLTTAFNSCAGTPGQFFDSDGNGFFKHHEDVKLKNGRDNHRWITHNGLKVWDNRDLPRSTIYTGVLNHVNSFKIDSGFLDRYMYFFLNPITNVLEFTEKTPKQVENEANFNIINKGREWTDRADITHSDWEHCSILYTYEQFKNIKES